MSERTETALAPSGGALHPEDAHALEEAVRSLHGSRGVLVRSADLLAGLIGQAATLGLRRLQFSTGVSRKMQGIAEAALRRAFDAAVLGIEQTQPYDRPVYGRIAAAASGVTFGFAGMAGFLPDATLTTLLIMRTIAAIAREEGEDLSAPETREACLQVFAFGGPALGGKNYGSVAEDADTGYWSARLFLQGRPLMMLFSEVASRYGLRISEKFAVQALPFLGAAGGALVNTVFLDHYRKLARVHFTVRRLERRYGAAEVQMRARSVAERMRFSPHAA